MLQYSVKVFNARLNTHTKKKKHAQTHTKFNSVCSIYPTEFSVSILMSNPEIHMAATFHVTLHKSLNNSF